MSASLAEPGPPSTRSTRAARSDVAARDPVDGSLDATREVSRESSRESAREEALHRVHEEAAEAKTPAPVEVSAELRAPRPSFLGAKPLRAVGWFLALAAVPYLHPSLASYRLFPFGTATPETTADPASVGIVPEYGELALKEAKNESPPILEDHGGELPPLVAHAAASAKPAPPVLSDVAQAVGATYRPIEDPSGHAMDGFYASLGKTEAGATGAVTRVAHYGDSLIVSDFMSSTLRRRFQSRFGDAGHGFVLLAKPWGWYFHQDVSHWSSDGWKVHRIVNPRIADELYGYGGATFRTFEGGTKASFGTAKPVPGDPKTEKEAFGRRVSRFDVHYLEQPDGGSFDLILDGKKAKTVSTRAPAGAAKKLAIATVEAPDGEHTLDVKAHGGAEARFFGVALERDVPGVVWDALGVNGGRARMLDVTDDAHWAESLRSRAPALVILQYGTNESEDTGYPQEQYEATLEAVLRQVRQALPGSSCLVVGPMDRAGHGAGGMETRPIILKLNESQRKIAFKAGCAFWDTFLSMGGSGAMGRWVRATPKLGGGDLTHPTMAGASLLGDLLYAALMNGYLERRP